MPKAPTISDLDIWRATNPLICRHGADAELVAARRADFMLDRGDRPFDRLRRAACLDADRAGGYGIASAAEGYAASGTTAAGNRPFFRGRV